MHCIILLCIYVFVYKHVNTDLTKTNTYWDTVCAHVSICACFSPIVLECIVWPRATVAYPLRQYAVIESGPGSVLTAHRGAQGCQIAMAGKGQPRDSQLIPEEEGVATTPQD